MKKLAILAIALAALAGFAEIAYVNVTGARNGNAIPDAGRVVAASLGSSAANGTFRLGIVSMFGVGTNVVRGTNLVFAGSYSASVSNAVLARPVYFKPGDVLLCDGLNATNGTARAVLFVER